jgi:SAM-dependent methyltransferase
MSAHAGKAASRLVQNFPPGGSTASPLNLAYRLAKIQKHVLLKGKWLDYGCADGAYTVGLASLGAESVVGVDVIEDRVADAGKLAQGGSGVEFFHVLAESLPFADASFDGVLMNEVLEHVRNEGLTLKEIHRVLRTEGHLVVMSPNRWFPFEGHGGRIGNLQLRHPVPLLPWLPRRIGQRFMHARNYWPYELRDLIADHGFLIRKVDFVWPVLEIYPWLPSALIRLYQKLIPWFEQIPLLNRFGVSILVAAQKSS